MIDKDILLQFKKGDEQALFTLMLQHYNDLFKYGIKFTADAELTKEIINAFFLHMWDNRSKLKAVENFKPYLVVSFKRFLITELRKRKNTTLPENVQDGLFELPYETFIIVTQQDAIVKETLHEMIAALPRRQKQLLQMRYYEQMSYEEIAEKTSLTVRTVYNKLHEALKNLRANKALRKIYKAVNLLALFPLIL